LLNPLSIYLHFKVLNIINSKHSVRDVLFILSRIKMYRMENGEIIRGIYNKVKKIISDMNIDMDTLPKSVCVMD
jgi:hypothetical protein